MSDDNYSIKEFIEHTMQDFSNKINDIHQDVKEIKIQTTKTNGRVNGLESWSADAKKLIEKVTLENEKVTKDYTINKTRLWTAVSLVVLLGGTIITLSVMIMDSKIQKAVETALKNNVSKIVYEE